MKNFLITISLVAIALISNAQPKTLEMSGQGSNTTLLGPTVAPVVVTFTYDSLNDLLATVFRPYITQPDNQSLTATFSFRNQQFINRNYGNVFTGMTFGSKATASTAGPIQQATPTNVYSLMNFDIFTGPSTDKMYMSNPNAMPSAKTDSLGNGGTANGFDSDGNYQQDLDGNPDGTFSVALGYTVEPLWEDSLAKNGRYYYGDLVIKFNRPVKKPVIHFNGLGGGYEFRSKSNIIKSSYFTTEYELQNADVTTTLLAGNPNFKVVGNNILNDSKRPESGSIFGTVSPLSGGTYYGAASGSARINETVEELVYKVYIRGSDSSSVNFSQNADSILGSTHDPFVTDFHKISISLSRPTQQISGNVFYDLNNTVGEINVPVGSNPALSIYSRTNVEGLVFANLIDPTTNTVIATTKIIKDGSFLFDSVAAASYYVQLTTNEGVIGNAIPLTELPAGWVHTGQRTGLIAGTDGMNDGLSANFTLPTGGIQTQVNFGVIQTGTLSVNNIILGGALNGNDANLVWNVQSGASFTSYTIEKSSDGVNFASVGSIASSVRLQSNYRDNVVNDGDKMYYRIKGIGTNGTFVYSNIIFFKKAGLIVSNIYPNPFKDVVKVEIESTGNVMATVKISTTAGQLVHKLDKQLQAGGNQITINNLAKLASGAYVVEVMSGSTHLVKQIIKE